MIDPTALLDQPPLLPEELVAVEQRMARLLGTRGDVVIFPGEAILGLEATIASIAGAGRTVLNIVTGPYGKRFGAWFRHRGSAVEEVTVADHLVAAADVIAEAIRVHRPQVLAIVQAEAATGGSNPLGDIMAAARAAGIVTLVDAVSAVGAEPVDADGWGADFVAIGPQKGVAGPAGISAVSVSERGWNLIEANPTAPRNSSLSLLDWREGWLRTDRTRIPGVPPWLEARAFIAAADRLQREGLGDAHLRHRKSSAAAVAGVEALGLTPWQSMPEARAPIVTTVRVPEGTTLRESDLGGIVSAGDGDLRGALIRVNHFGRNASWIAVEQAIGSLASTLGVPPVGAVEVARTHWETCE